MTKLTDEVLKGIEFDLSYGPQFVNLCKQLYIDENARFLLAVLRYKKNPTFTLATEIYETFVKPGSPDYVNLPAVKVLNPLTAYFDRMTVNQNVPLKVTRSHSRPLPAPPGLFNDAYAEIMALLSTNIEQNRGRGGGFAKQADSFFDKVDLALSIPGVKSASY